jgi:hypothetical protein
MAVGRLLLTRVVTRTARTRHRSTTDPEIRRVSTYDDRHFHDFRPGIGAAISPGKKQQRFAYEHTAQGGFDNDAVLDEEDR